MRHVGFDGERLAPVHVHLSQALAKLRAGVFSGEPGGGGSWMIRSIWLVR